MSLFDIFKKKKKEPSLTKIKEVKVKEKKKRPDKKKEEVKIEPLKKSGVRPRDRKVYDKTYQILYSPHITEKAADLEKNNKYVFKVFPKANKIEIAKAIEGIYGIDVESVKIIKVSRKKRRLGRQTGWKKGYKKAIVKVKEGQKIEILPR